MEKQKQSRRLLSLDALRGFDMFFIMGGASLFVALATLFPNSFFQAIGGQMDHVEWDGLTHHDTIFPLFLFIAGISFPFSLEKQREQGKSESDIYKRIVRRGITLVLLGCVYNGLLQFDFANLRGAYWVGMDVCRLAVRAFPDFSQGVDSRDDLGRLLGLDSFYPCAGCGGRTVHAGRQLGRLCGSFVVAGAFASRIF